MTIAALDGPTVGRKLRPIETKEHQVSPLLIVTLIVWLISSVGLTILILMHSGKGTGLSDMMASSIYSGTSGSSIVEKNLDRLTLIFVILFVASIMVLMLIYPKGTVLS
jgi:preprotein translocase subunit SecG